MSKSKRVILGVTASIAAYKAADIIRRLQEKNCQVSVVMTRDSEKFISALTLGAIAGERVHRDMFDETDDGWTMKHITLAREADIFLIAPATANIIGKIANGLADDLLTCTVMATKAPIIMAPAMNDEMFHNSILQGNITKLKKLGVRFVDPVIGKLACGTTGEGHLAEVDAIVSATLRTGK